MSFNISNINTNWTLFLDRDGVINVEKDNDYIKTWNEFEFYKESIEALPMLANLFKTIVTANFTSIAISCLFYISNKFAINKISILNFNYCLI